MPVGSGCPTFTDMLLRSTPLFLCIAALATVPACESDDTGGDQKTDGARIDAAKADGGVEGWHCQPSYFDADDGCDCGCGVPDPDCGGDESLDACDYEFCGSGEVDPTDNALCTDDGAATSCPDDVLENGVCDCGCGEPDPDCDSTYSSACEVDHCPQWYSAHTFENHDCYEDSLPGPFPPGPTPEPGDGSADGGDDDEADGMDCRCSSDCAAGYACRWAACSGPSCSASQSQPGRCTFSGTLPSSIDSECYSNHHCSYGERCENLECVPQSTSPGVYDCD